MANQFSREMKISTIVIVLTTLVFFGAFFWLQSDMGIRANEDAMLTGQIASQARAVSALAQNKQDAAVAARYRKAIDTLIPAKDDIVNFPQWLDAKARTWRVSTTFSFGGNGTSPQSGQAGYVNFTLNINGNVNDIIGFFDDIETKSPQYLIAIDALGFQKVGGGYTATAQGRVFFK